MSVTGRVLLLVPLSLLACGGGATSAPPPASSSGAAGSPAASCLAIAGARREKKAGEPAKITDSEEPGAATREGTVGSIARGDVAAPFADAAFELGRGEVSHVVETDFGFHIILRVE